MARHDPRTIRRARTLSRIVGALLGMLLGIFYALFIIDNGGGAIRDNSSVALAAILAAGVAGAASLALAAPMVSVEPFLWLEAVLEEASIAELIGALGGLLFALTIAALVAVLLSPLPWGIGFAISVCLACVLVYVGVRTGRRRRAALIELFTRRGGEAATVGEVAPLDGTPIVVDTSVLIDGRVTDVAATGFIQGRLVIAGFVLEELQRVADSADPVKRARGRRGLAVVETLRESRDVVCEIVDLDFPGTPEVDARLIRLARGRGASLFTSDFNLNRVARLAGVRVLNLNDLANALKPVVSAGEPLRIAITKEGRERHQGVGYLEDGTMVVVENGRDYLDSTVDAVVSSVLQTPAGRMIFAAMGQPQRPSVRPQPG